MNPQTSTPPPSSATPPSGTAPPTQPPAPAAPATSINPSQSLSVPSTPHRRVAIITHNIISSQGTDPFNVLKLFNNVKKLGLKNYKI